MMFVDPEALESVAGCHKNLKMMGAQDEHL
jgi:hypothetical protein